MVVVVVDRTEGKRCSDDRDTEGKWRTQVAHPERDGIWEEGGGRYEGRGKPRNSRTEGGDGNVI